MTVRKIVLRKCLWLIMAPVLLATPVAAQEEPSYRYLSTSFSVTDVDTTKLLGRLGRVGVTIPFDMEGEVSAKLRIQIPINGLRDTKAYRFDGTISSKRLNVAGLSLLNVEMDAAYRDGVLNLNPLAFQIPDPAPNGLAPGKFKGTARMEIQPRGDLALDLQLDTVPAAALNEIANQPGLLTGGVLSGKVEATMPAAEVRDLSTWDLDGQFSATGLMAMDRELQKASFQFRAENGALKVNDLTATMEGASLQGSAVANLTGNRSYNSDLRLIVNNLGGVLPNTEALQLTNPMQATANVNGTLTPFKFLASGQATLPRTNIGPLSLQSGRLNYSVNDEKIAIDDLNLQLYEGAIRGSATLPREGETAATLQLNLEPALALNPIVQDLTGQELQLAGRIVGTVKGEVPRPQLSDLSAWDASANLSIQQGTAWGLDISRGAIQVLLQNGVVSLSETGLTWANSALDVAGRVRLADPQTFDAKVKLEANDLNDLNQLAEDVRRWVDVEGNLHAELAVKGQLKEFQWQATGTMGSDQLQFDKVRLNSLSAKVAADPKAITLTEFQLELYEGQVTGTGKYPLDRQVAGTIQFDADAINFGGVAQEYLGPSPPVTGILSGHLTANSPVPPANQEREWTTDARFKIPTITVDAIEAGHLDGKLDYKNQQLDYRVTGEVFDGDFELIGEYPTEEEPPPPAEAAEPEAASLPLGTGKIKLDKLQLQKVWRAFLKSPDSGNLAGLLQIEFEWSSTAETQPAGSGSVVLNNVTWNSQPITNQLEAQLELRDQQILVNNLRGIAAGGQVEASVVWGLENAQSRLVQFRGRNLDLPVLAQFTPLGKDFAEGRVDIEARILPRDIWRLDIHLHAERLRVQGVSLQSVTLPIHGSLLSSFARADLTLSSVAASVAGGRIKGRVTLGWGDRRRIDGELNFAKIDTELLVQEALGSRLPGDGTLSGTIDLTGKNMTTWTETQVEVDAKLSRAQPRRLPVVEALQSVAQSIAIAQPIQEGRIQATYSQGTVAVQSVTLTGPTLELLIWGTVASNQRLSLNAIIRTGRRSFDRRISHLIGGNLGTRLVGLLADRLIQVRITGTIDRPIVNVKPLSLINIKALQ